MADEPDDFVDADIFDPAVVEHFENAVRAQEKEQSSGVQSMLDRRTRAYRAVFTAGQRDQADIDIVLNDLMWFCRAWQSTFDPHDGVHAEVLSHMKSGRREVIQRIKDFSCLDSDALLLKYTDAITKL